jgi:uncharacterized protein YndB with AHSA1/START domain
MTTPSISTHPLDLVFERVIDIPPALAWLAWTTPERLKKWFTPAPWQTVDCEIDLRPTKRTSTLPCDQFAITATISLAPHGSGTKYSARVAHADEASRQKHADMKFEEGWGKALDQLVAHVKQL